uniref:Uncharacterized protein n=1 Tax=viral metagenome TaxID=1070528 RepID=A0A6C0DCC1_9ZZZZ
MNPEIVVFEPGDFSFIKSVAEKAIYCDMYKAVEKLGIWEELKNEPFSGGFLFGTTDIPNRIMANLENPDAHSGASLALCIRDMQYIAIHGWPMWVLMYDLSQ